MLNEAEAFTLKNKKYATENDLMTSENSFLNCFRPKDFEVSVSKAGCVFPMVSV